MKVAIVHDILDSYGGAERVVDAIIDAFPNADLFVSRYTKNPETKHIRDRVDVRGTFMQSLPYSKLLMKLYVPLYPMAFEHLNLDDYDVIISSTAHFAKNIVTKPDQQHICYCHTPPRFLYGFSTETDTRSNPYLKPILQPLDTHLRQVDYFAAQRPDVFLTNSKTTQRRIKKYYGRDAIVLYPPIEVDNFKPTITDNSKDYFLSVSRLVPYKHVDLIVKACIETNTKLKVIGSGPMEQELRILAAGSENIDFEGFVSDNELVSMYQSAKGLIVAAEDEDFGIVPVECMASGTPVIGYKKGGFAETIVHGETGILFNELRQNAIVQALNDFDNYSFASEKLKSHASRFSKQSFIAKLRQQITK